MPDATLTFLGHAGFLMTDGTHTLAVDPFLTDNPVATHTPEDIACSHIALTHGHEDHFGDTIPIAKANNATVIAAYEICNHCAAQGVEHVDPGNPGGTIETPFGSVTFTQAFHSSSYQGKYMGQPCGLVIRIGGKTIYHCGDTALFSDMKLLGELFRPDIALIPAGDRFTMGPAHAAKAAELIGAPIAVPIHHGTWPPIAADLSAFTPAGVEVRHMAAGDTLTLG